MYMNGLRNSGLLLALFALSGQIAVADTNLLPNGDFSTAQQLTGWQALPPGATFLWKADDAGLDANSGSMEVAGTLLGGHMQSACFQVNPGAPYSFGAQYRISSGGPAKTMNCMAYGSSTCDSANQIGFLGNWAGGPYSTSWVSWGPYAGTLPANAIAVTCEVDASANGVGGTVEFDNVYFNSALATPVELESFEIR